MNSDGKPKPEILIIRRSSGDDHGGHKGGAWKIAYADFVTAMMAFFLVMWLINSANEVTKSRVASYFNPIKMTDPTPSGKGLKEETSSRNSEGKKQHDGNSEKPAGSSETKSGKTDEQKISVASAPETQLLQKPYESLDTIVQSSSGSSGIRRSDTPSQIAGDPFDPMAWESLKQKKPLDGETVPLSKGTDATQTPETTAKPNVVNPEAKVDQTSPKSATSSPATTDQAAAQDVNKLAEEVRSKLSAMIGKLDSAIDIKVEVKVTDEGLLIVLEDGKTRSMFSVGSARPNPALVELVGTIGLLLENQNGPVIIRGHTDARRYKGSFYDNWQLSTARAHMASYMLIRGGLKEERIKKIEGYGAGSLLNADDPLADENRRVEFLLAK
jgi:chemotaxis protein MotB